MNHAHTSHYTDAPDPAIRHVLRGWNPEGGPAVHDVEIGDVRVRKVEALIMPEKTLGTSLLGMSFMKRLSNVAMAGGRLTFSE